MKVTIMGLAALTLSAALASASTPSADPGETTALKPWFSFDTLGFHHEGYSQTVDGLPVLDAAWVSHTSHDGRLSWAEDGTVAARDRSGSFGLSDADAVIRAQVAASVLEPSSRHPPTVQRVWAQQGEGLRKAYAVTLSSDVPAGAFRVVIDGVTGATLGVQDLALRATAQVFRVNPIVGLQDAAFRDNTLSVDDGSFAGALMEVDLDNFSPAVPVGWGSNRIRIADGLAPPDGLPVAPRREDPRFLEQMVYFYVEHALARLAALGYTDILGEPVEAYSHDPPVFRGGRVPFPSPWPDAYATQGRIHFFLRAPSPLGASGTGSSAEDGEVIVHELGHLVHTGLAPQVEYVPDWYGRWAEGTADILAALLLDDLSLGFGDPCMSEWITTYYPELILPKFRHGDLECLRVLENGFVWPADGFGEIHRDGQFWASPLWDLRGALGTNTTLRLILEALPLTPAEIDSFEDLGDTVLLADAGLYGGAHEQVIRESFASHGIKLATLAEVVAATGVPRPAVPAPTPAIAPSPAVESTANRESPVAPAPWLVLGLLTALAVARRRP